MFFCSGACAKAIPRKVIANKQARMRFTTAARICSPD
jgi:hypothetical protein